MDKKILYITGITGRRVTLSSLQIVWQQSTTAEAPAHTAEHCFPPDVQMHFKGAKEQPPPKAESKNMKKRSF